MFTMLVALSSAAKAAYFIQGAGIGVGLYEVAKRSK